MSSPFVFLINVVLSSVLPFLRPFVRMFLLGVMYVQKKSAVKVASREVYSSHDALDVVYTFRREGGGDVYYKPCEVTA
jgi:hypothetical protein